MKQTELPYSTATSPSLEEVAKEHAESLEQVIDESSKPTTNLKYSQLVKVELPSRLTGSTKVYFEEILHVTKEHAVKQGAILLSFDEAGTEDPLEQWIPKTLCSNLDPKEKTVYVFTGFVEDNMDWVLSTDDDIDEEE